MGFRLVFWLGASSMLAALSGQAWAQNAAIPGQRSGDDLGIVVNQTVTPGGQEFYRRFTDYWREKPDFERHTLVISERPSRRYGNQITVSVGRRAVFFGGLPLKLEAIRSASADAVEKAYADIIAATLRFGDKRDPDLGNEEL
jgi:curli production assembly/transport component CsgE